MWPWHVLPTIHMSFVFVQSCCATQVAQQVNHSNGIHMQRLLTGFMPTETANASNSLEDIAPYQNCGIAKLLSVTLIRQAANGIYHFIYTALLQVVYTILYILPCCKWYIPFYVFCLADQQA